MSKKVVHSVISTLVKIFHRQRFGSRSESYFIKPTPKYISQFIGIYPQSIKFGEQLTNQKHVAAFGAKDAEEFSFWSWRNCGIACVQMILDSKIGDTKSMMELTREGIKLGGYVLYENNVFVDKGWFHHALVNLLKANGVNAQMKKWQSIYSVTKDILHNKLVILSVTVPGRSHISLDGLFGVNNPNAKWGGHLLLATGVKLSYGKVAGVYVHDPRGLPMYQENTFIPKAIFEAIFSGRTIVTSS